ncbi:SGNH/GDSL hydrolase family protein [Anatilimnocola floriformis]|uniref:SGNH/GDSL hydrolase family protein n=1 Tax=Anatilimnocola floriformis TaxID=2948575 RepID=UPI0020C2CD41|nr:SGNH/GDSL hydrolase family protein [Anatilimnocola floriformis]
MPGHLVLLGDSIFDNAYYVPGGPAVNEHVRRLLPKDWQASLLAVDGAKVADVARQLEQLPETATHLVLSIGGNNALWSAGNFFPVEASTVRDAMTTLAAAREEFQSEYRGLVKQLRGLRKGLAICTVYDAIPGITPAEIAGLCLFNDVITRTAIAAKLTLIDLRTICNEASDFSSLSPIEPSAAGGGKIARGILDALFEPTAGCHVIG